MKNKNNAIDKINTKLVILITCAVLIISALFSCSVQLASSIAFMRSLPQNTTSGIVSFFESTSNSTTQPETTRYETTNQQVTAGEFPLQTTSPLKMDSTKSSTTKIQTTTQSNDTASHDTTTEKQTEKSNLQQHNTISENTTSERITKPQPDGKYYVTASGTKYHTSVCTYLTKSKIEISLSEAIEKGYEPCSRCIEAVY